MTNLGRPTKYKPEVIEQINEYLKEAIPQNMKIPTIEGIALKLGINRDTLYEWAKKYPDFSDTLEKLKLQQKEYLTEIGIFGGKEINATIVQLLLKVNHSMIETERKELVGENGGPIQINYIDRESLSEYLNSHGSSEESLGQPSQVSSIGVAQESKENINSTGEGSVGST